mgnify:CR=1 FL=1
MIDIVSLLKPKKQKKTAGEVAKERLKLVLIHDRANCESDLLESIRKDIMEVLSKYMEIDMEMEEGEDKDAILMDLGLAMDCIGACLMYGDYENDTGKPYNYFED